jgi:DNA adenine methylase
MINEPTAISPIRRLGNKRKLMPKLLPLFPKHDVFIEPFFGSGAVLFSKPLAQYNFVNDFDNDVYNVFMQVLTNEQALYDLIETIPYHNGVFQFFRTWQPDNDLQRAAKFLVLSSYSYLGGMNTLKFGLENHKTKLLENIKKTSDFLLKTDIKFNNKDFRDFLRNISFRDENGQSKTFAYLDPPYLGTGDNYSNSFTETDTRDLVEQILSMNIKFAMSEFAHPFVLELAKKHKLHVEVIGERKTLKSRNTEILIMNYLPEVSQTKLF